MAEEQAIPEHIWDQAIQIAATIIWPAAWTYTPSAEEIRLADYGYQSRLAAAARPIVPFLLAAELRGRTEQREADARRLENEAAWNEEHAGLCMSDTPFGKRLNGSMLAIARNLRRIATAIRQ